MPTPWQPRRPVYPCRARLGRRNGTAQAPASAHALGLRRQSCQALLRSCPSPPACLCQARGCPAAPRLARRAAPLPLSRPHPGPAPHPLARRGRLPLAWPCRGALPSRRHAQGSRAARARHRLGRAAPRLACDPAWRRARLAGTAGAKADQRGAAGCPVRRPPGPARRAALDGHAAAHPGSGRRPPVAARCWPPGRRPARMRPRAGSRRPPQPRQARRRPARCQARPRQPRRAPWPRPQHSTMGLPLGCLGVAAVVRLAACARNMHVRGAGRERPCAASWQEAGLAGQCLCAPPPLALFLCLFNACVVWACKRMTASSALHSEGVSGRQSEQGMRGAASRRHAHRRAPATAACSASTAAAWRANSPRSCACSARSSPSRAATCPWRVVSFSACLPPARVHSARTRPGTLAWRRERVPQRRPGAQAAARAAPPALRARLTQQVRHSLGLIEWVMSEYVLWSYPSACSQRLQVRRRGGRVGPAGACTSLVCSCRWCCCRM